MCSKDLSQEVPYYGSVPWHAACWNKYSVFCLWVFRLYNSLCLWLLAIVFGNLLDFPKAHLAGVQLLVQHVHYAVRWRLPPLLCPVLVLQSIPHHMPSHAADLIWRLHAQSAGNTSVRFITCLLLPHCRLFTLSLQASN